MDKTIKFTILGLLLLFGSVACDKAGNILEQAEATCTEAEIRLNKGDIEGSIEAYEACMALFPDPSKIRESWVTEDVRGQPLYSWQNDLKKRYQEEVRKLLAYGMVEEWLDQGKVDFASMERLVSDVDPETLSVGVGYTPENRQEWDALVARQKDLLKKQASKLVKLTCSQRSVSPEMCQEVRQALTRYHPEIDLAEFGTMGTNQNINFAGEIHVEGETDYQYYEFKGEQYCGDNSVPVQETLTMTVTSGTSDSSWEGTNILTGNFDAPIESLVGDAYNVCEELEAQNSEAWKTIRQQIVKQIENLPQF